MQLGVECTDGTDTVDCVPECSPELHGYMLLLNIEGEDSKLSCELHHELYSWVGSATDGGYLGADYAVLFSAVVSGAAGIYVGMLLEDAGIHLDLTIQPGQTVSISGDPSLVLAPQWGSGGFTVQERGSLELTYIRLGSAVAIMLHSGGSLSLASLAIPVAVVSAAVAGLGGAGSVLRLNDIRVLEYHYSIAQSLKITVNDDGTTTTEGSLSIGTPVFEVMSGPCEISRGGCVGRANGYLGSEQCAITVSGGAGVLAACSVFDLDIGASPAAADIVVLPGVQHTGSDCPAGAVLAPGSPVGWRSDAAGEGNVGDIFGVHYENGCHAKGLCGLPAIMVGLGGGWQICFESPVPGCVNPTASNFNLAATVGDGSCIGGIPFRTGVKWETWQGAAQPHSLPLISNPLRTRPFIADTPTSTGFLTQYDFFELSVEEHTIGARLTTYFLAPQTGDYIFVIAGDDKGELWLGSDEPTLQRIAFAPGFTGVREWDKVPTQTSAPQRLEAGNHYLMHALESNGGGSGHLEVGVTLPGGEELRPIPVHAYLFEPPQ